MDTTIINLTPHPVTFLDSEGKLLCTFDAPKKGGEARCVEIVQASTTYISGSLIIPTRKKMFGTVTNLPAEKDGTLYIVSQIVFSAKPERKDLLVPDGVLRDEKGQVKGCTCFGCR